MRVVYKMTVCVIKGQVELSWHQKHEKPYEKIARHQQRMTHYLHLSFQNAMCSGQRPKPSTLQPSPLQTGYLHPFTLPFHIVHFTQSYVILENIHQCNQINKELKYLGNPLSPTSCRISFVCKKCRSCQCSNALQTSGRGPVKTQKTTIMIGF